MTMFRYRNGQEIKPDARVEMRDKDTKYTMVIKKATKEDAGRIKVRYNIQLSIIGQQ